MASQLFNNNGASFVWKRKRIPRLDEHDMKSASDCQVCPNSCLSHILGRNEHVTNCPPSCPKWISLSQCTVLISRCQNRKDMNIMLFRTENLTGISLRVSWEKHQECLLLPLFLSVASDIPSSSCVSPFGLIRAEFHVSQETENCILILKVRGSRVPFMRLVTAPPWQTVEDGRGWCSLSVRNDDDDCSLLLKETFEVHFNMRDENLLLSA